MLRQPCQRIVRHRRVARGDAKRRNTGRTGCEGVPCWDAKTVTGEVRGDAVPFLTGLGLDTSAINTQILG